MSFRSDLYGSIPGFSSAYETYENAFKWGRDNAALIVGILLDGTARDVGNTPSTVLRPGLVLGQIGASGNWRDFGDNNIDGSDEAGAVLISSFRMTDLDSNNVQRFVWALVGGPVRANKLLGLTEQARVQMSGRFFFDDRSYVQEGVPRQRTIAKTANYTVVAADNGTCFTTTGAVAPVNFTLPAPAKGLRYRFFNTVNQNMVVTAPATKLIGLNGTGFTTLTFSTANQKLGAVADVEADDTGSNWLAIPLGTATPTYA